MPASRGVSGRDPGAEYLPLRRWNAGLKRLPLAMTPFQEKALKEAAWKLPTETQEDLRRQKMTSNELVDKEWFGRHKRHKKEVARKLAQKYMDDVRTSTQSQEDYWHHLSAMDSSYQQRMLQDIMSEKELQTQSQMQSDELNKTGSSKHERAHQLRHEREASEVLERENRDRVLTETAEMARDRKQAQVLALAKIKKQCRQNRQTSESCPHEPRMAYFKFGGTGHVAPISSQSTRAWAGRNGRGGAWARRFVQPTDVAVHEQGEIAPAALPKPCLFSGLVASLL